MTGLPPLVRCDDVARTYGTGAGAVVAVHGSSCAIDAGARIAITGPSGSGKSTLLLLLAGLETPSSGSVTWPGIPDGPGSIDVIFQGPSLVPSLNGLENVMLPLLFGDVGEREAQDRARAALDAVGVTELADRLPEEMSGGQAQRVAVARAIAGRPRLIVADEPTGQLDHNIGEQLVSTLMAAADELDAALVISTHDPAISRRFPVEWEMRDGRLMAGAVTEGGHAR